MLDLTYDIRALAPDLIGDSGEAPPKTRSEETRWMSEVPRRCRALESFRQIDEMAPQGRALRDMLRNSTARTAAVKSLEAVWASRSTRSMPRAAAPGEYPIHGRAGASASRSSSGRCAVRAPSGSRRLGEFDMLSRHRGSAIRED